MRSNAFFKAAFVRPVCRLHNTVNIRAVGKRGCKGFLFVHGRKVAVHRMNVSAEPADGRTHSRKDRFRKVVAVDALNGREAALAAIKNTDNSGS